MEWWYEKLDTLLLLRCSKASWKPTRQHILKFETQPSYETQTCWIKNSVILRDKLRRTFWNFCCYQQLLTGCFSKHSTGNVGELESKRPPRLFSFSNDAESFSRCYVIKTCIRLQFLLNFQIFFICNFSQCFNQQKKLMKFVFSSV
jgi:hypothetical protein